MRRRTRGRRFLDAGCNAGFATEAARTLGFDALGVDVDPVTIDTARQLFPKARFAAEDIATLATRGEQFDVLYCSEVIEHLPRPLPFLHSLRQLLAPGGRALLTTPDLGHRSLPEHLIGTEMIRPPEHLLYFDPRFGATCARGQRLRACAFSDDVQADVEDSRVVRGRGGRVPAQIDLVPLRFHVCAAAVRCGPDRDQRVLHCAI